jgi:2-keto-4-pentenoate hydratase/2-oxohepta-3-ene-1,7-dioic acid hydratase in catechol pathway
LYLELHAAGGWVAVAKCLEQIENSSTSRTDPLAADLLALLAAPQEVRDRIAKAAAGLAPRPADRDVVMPFEPRSFRDFMLYEAHAIAAARGFVNAFMPAAAPVVRTYERLTRRTFPKLKPHALWYRQPIYYMGNHLNIAADGADIAVPRYTRALDYELELGLVLAHPLRDATPQEAEAAIGGFLVLNDFSARDVQADEMASGFGPQKAKHFASAISSVVVTADEILPRWSELSASVRLNGVLISETSTAGARWSLGEVLAHACRGEQLYPGELIGSGTLPGGSGIETGHLLKSGDTVEIAIDGIGSVSNRIV